MSERIEFRGLEQEKISFGDILCLTRLLAIFSIYDSNDKKKKVGNEEINSIMSYFLKNNSEIPILQDISKFDNIIKEVLKVDDTNISLFYGFFLEKISLGISSINKEFFDYANTNIWKIVINEFINLINNCKDFKKLLRFKVSINIPMDYITEWYGDEFTKELFSDVNMWLKYYRIGVCQKVLTYSKKVVCMLEIGLCSSHRQFPMESWFL